MIYFQGDMQLFCNVAIVSGSDKVMFSFPGQPANIKAGDEL